MKTVKVYSTPVCPYCVMAKNYLKKNNVSYEDIDVSVDENSAKEMIEKSHQLGVPVIDIEGSIIIGFDKEAVNKALGL
ncbi:NrdH-redoxin [Candidatus Wolfebacteria bacterium CG10_big_fil_rev_8_21_14_0_10_31_9]|uniref:NrdH-redoxin n=1 Tax=Candidatus Wolfebacteria bacterium CG10_big_fil_rev_8_21_14_0_10_31_9 TaxID=1975070 RepID=A0A2H0RCW2_9BACT|nr:MAG: NrdH-redoxin [Candidatus Wolfebacteria bacterium CG10_big_fil_rev_8_21_14_0_10_31_9]